MTYDHITCLIMVKTFPLENLNNGVVVFWSRFMCLLVTPISPYEFHHIGDVI